MKIACADSPLLEWEQDNTSLKKFQESENQYLMVVFQQLQQQQQQHITLQGFVQVNGVIINLLLKSE